MLNKRLQFALLAAALFLCTSAAAETIHLKSGTKVSGKILERTEKYVKVDFHGVPIKYNLTDIEKIEAEAVKEVNNAEAAPKNEVVDTPQVPQEIQKIEEVKPKVPAEINWQYDLDEALNMARRDSKPVMVDFYADWCGWCKKLDSDVYTDQTVRELSGKFICVKVNGDNNRSAAGRYNVRGYPTIIFLDKNGNVLKTIPGYVNADAMAEAMSFAAGAPSSIQNKPLAFIDIPGNRAVDMVKKVGPVVLIFAFVFAFIWYLYSSFALMRIAEKAGHGAPWVAWVPIANIFLMFNVADISYWFMLLLIVVAFIPIFGIICHIIFSIYLWYKIALAVNKPGWLGALMIVPIVNIFIIGYLGFSKLEGLEYREVIK